MSCRFVCTNNFEHSTALMWYEIRASGWVSMTGSVEFVRYKTSVSAGTKLNSALAFAAKAKVHQRARPRRSERSNCRVMLHLNGWFGEIR